MEFSLEIEELRAIIEGRRSYRKCPTCMGKGFEWYCGNKGEVFLNQQGDSEAFYAGQSDYVLKDGCTNCQQLGYVVAVWED